jgi:hypothetical protein
MFVQHPNYERALTKIYTDYVVQTTRFTVVEGFGCKTSVPNGGLPLLLINSWTVLLPLISITVYSRKLYMVLLAILTDP